MIVVAIIAVLAAIVIPGWTKQSQQAKADSEVNAMMTEIANKEEIYKSENNGKYLAASQCPTSTYAQSGSDWNTTCGSAVGWTSLHVAAPDMTMYCNYQVGSGGGSSVTGLPSGFTMTTSMLGSQSYWYWIMATCDMDNNTSSTAATFFRSSTDTKIQKQNYGQ